MTLAALLLAGGPLHADDLRPLPAAAGPPALSIVKDVLAAAVPTIAFTGGAFVPKRLDVEPGTRVRFLNASSEAFWPASNIHPTHLILPELDAGGGIAPGDDYEFTFERRGFWRYHNHLAPDIGGLVVVLGGEAGAPAEPLQMNLPERAFETPESVSGEDVAALMSDDALLERFVRRFGPEETVRLLKRGEGLTGKDCHQRAHHLGRAAFEEFGAAAFALSGHECMAGSFHGATEALFAERGTANLEQDVAAICGGGDNRFFYHQCLHGVGHGLLAWSSYELLDALPLCARLATQGGRASCYSGVFMENVVGGLAGIMGHRSEFVNDHDPHFPCNAIPERYRWACYAYQSSQMLVVLGHDFEAVALACAEAPKGMRRTCFWSYGRDVGGVTRGDPETAVRYCGYAPEGLWRIACIEGAVQDRFWEASGAAAALALCALVEDPLELDACYRTIIIRARYLFTTREEVRGFCAGVKGQWRKWCDAVLLELASR